MNETRATALAGGCVPSVYADAGERLVSGRMTIG
jgi:hypothetical protein